MKGLFKKLIPLGFAVFTFLIYFAIYNPQVNSFDFTNSLLLFFTAMGSGAIIEFAQEPQKQVYYFYLSIAVALPIVMVFFAKSLLKVDTIHQVSVGLMLLGLFYLWAFISSLDSDE